MLPTFITTNQSQSSCREIGKGAGKEVVSGDGIDCKWLLANKSKLCSSAAYYADCAPAILYICMYIYIVFGRFSIGFGFNSYEIAAQSCCSSEAAAVAGHLCSQRAWRLANSIKKLLLC